MDSNWAVRLLICFWGVRVARMPSDIRKSMVFGSSNPEVTEIRVCL